jgi:hypothetical protein
MKKLPVISANRFCFYFENGNIFMSFIKINVAVIAYMFPPVEAHTIKGAPVFFAADLFLFALRVK